MEPARKRPAARAVNRNSDLAAIHIRATKLGLIKPAREGFAKNDDDYRQLVRTISNNTTDSAARLDHTQRAALLAHLSRLERATGKGGPPPQWRMLRGLWHELHGDKMVDEDTEKALNAWCARQLDGPVGRWKGFAALASARWYGNEELTFLIEAAKAWLRRKQG